MKVTYTNDAFPKGHEFYVEQLASFPNGEQVELTADQLAAFENFTGLKFADVVKSNPMYSVGSAKGGE